MASIQKKRLKSGDSYYIVQRYKDETGKTKQAFIHCASHREAILLLDEVNKAEKEGRRYSSPPKIPGNSSSFLFNDPDLTVKKLLELYIQHHSQNRKWEASTRKSALAIIRNYILPYIGEQRISQLKTADMQRYYNHLLTCKAAIGNHTSDPGNVSPRTVREVHKILRPAFTFAVKQGYLDTNPMLNIELPKEDKYERVQWTEQEFRQAVTLCDDIELRTMLLLAFSLTLRTGELLGLTREHLYLNPPDGKPYLWIKQTLERLDKQAIQETGTVVYREFPPVAGGHNISVLVLKKPKTEKSIRKIYMAPSIAKQLREYIEWKKQTPPFLLGIAKDYGLVFCNDLGMPYTNEVISKRFHAFIKKHDLRKVSFYSLRHSGATAKLRASHDIKAVQGDMGHSSTDMLMNTYAAIVDEERQKLAENMEVLLFAPDESPKEHDDV